MRFICKKYILSWSLRCLPGDHDLPDCINLSLFVELAESVAATNFHYVGNLAILETERNYLIQVLALLRYKSYLVTIY